MLPALVLLLTATAVTYLWDLSASGYANSFYAAAVQAGTKSWKAFFFGSIDSSNFITVDKSPASLWVMELSGRLFGFSSWSMLAPQVLEGVAAVGLVYAAVKRWFGAPAGLAAGAVLASTPVAALMFRYDNPDALMVLLLVAAAYTLVRALERAGTRWVAATGALIGLAFLAKMLQSFTVLPAFVGVYLLAAPTGLRRRLGQMALMGLSILLAAGWWVAAVALWPASSRPLIDGSGDNSILNLIFGYNGLERLSGSGGGAGFSGPTGVLRLFNELMGGQASWLLPAALVALVAGLVSRGRAPRTDRERAAVMLWGGWLVVTGAVFSLSSGVIHTYYTVALAPAIAALVGMGGAQFWRHRDRPAARVTASSTVVITALWAFDLLGRTPAYEPWLRWWLLLVGIASGVALVAAPVAPRAADPDHRGRNHPRTGGRTRGPDRLHGHHHHHAPTPGRSRRPDPRRTLRRGRPRRRPGGPGGPGAAPADGSERVPVVRQAAPPVGPVGCVPSASGPDLAPPSTVPAGGRAGPGRAAAGATATGGSRRSTRRGAHRGAPVPAHPRTGGWPRRSVRSRPPPSSSPPVSRSWPSAGSTGRVGTSPSPRSRPTWPRETSTGSSPRATRAGRVAPAAREQRRRHHQLGRVPLHPHQDRGSDRVRPDQPVVTRPHRRPRRDGPGPAPGTGVRGGRRQTVLRLVRYSTVSVVSTSTSLVVLAVLVGLMGAAAVPANVVATAVGTVPSFELNRRWVWCTGGRRSVVGQVLPFCALSATGLVVSTVAVGAASTRTLSWGHWAHTAAVLAANVTAYGSLWIAQYVLLDRVLFRVRAAAPGGLGDRSPVRVPAAAPGGDADGPGGTGSGRPRPVGAVSGWSAPAGPHPPDRGW